MQKSIRGFSFKRKKKKAVLEDVSGKAPDCQATELLVPLHNLLLPRRTEFFSRQKLCTKKYITIEKRAQLAGLAP